MILFFKYSNQWLFLGVITNLNGFGDNVMPSYPSVLGILCPCDTRNSKECKNVAKNRNNVDLAKFSPMQRRFPEPNGKN